MRNIKVGSIYKHFKGDNYLVLSAAIYCETNEELVIYKALYGENKVYARKKDMFLSKVDTNKYPFVKQKYRFEEIKIDSVNK